MNNVAAPRKLKDAHLVVSRVDVSTSRDKEASVTKPFKEAVVGHFWGDPLDSDKVGNRGWAAGWGSVRLGARWAGRTQ